MTMRTLNMCSSIFLHSVSLCMHWAPWTFNMCRECRECRNAERREIQTQRIYVIVKRVLFATVWYARASIITCLLWRPTMNDMFRHLNMHCAVSDFVYFFLLFAGAEEFTERLWALVVQLQFEESVAVQGQFGWVRHDLTGVKWLYLWFDHHTTRHASAHGK